MKDLFRKLKERKEKKDSKEPRPLTKEELIQAEMGKPVYIFHIEDFEMYPYKKVSIQFEPKSPKFEYIVHIEFAHLIQEEFDLVNTFFESRPLKMDFDKINALLEHNQVWFKNPKLDLPANYMDIHKGLMNMDIEFYEYQQYIEHPLEGGEQRTIPEPNRRIDMD